MKKLGFELGNSSSQIIPIMIGSEVQAVQLSEELLKEGLFAQAIRYPTVKKGKARLRTSLSAIHLQEHLDSAVNAFRRAGKKTRLL
jgi:glycine C-acetyltransferase